MGATLTGAPCGTLFPLLTAEQGKTSTRKPAVHLPSAFTSLPSIQPPGQRRYDKSCVHKDPPSLLLPDLPKSVNEGREKTESECNADVSSSYDLTVIVAAPDANMPSKRQQEYMMQQQLIYAGGQPIRPIHREKSTLVRHHHDLATKRERSGDLPPKRERTELPSAPLIRKREPRERLSHTSPSSHKTPDLLMDIAKRQSKDLTVTGRPRRQRPPMYIPPIHYGDRHVPRNVVTVDTSKARGNTDVIRLVTRDLGWREVNIPL